jgi:hypothetical protein
MCVRSEKAGQRVYEGLKRLIGKLRLEVNEEKSAVDLAVRRDFLGYGFWVFRKERITRRVARKALVAMKERVREITNRNAGRSLKAVVARNQPTEPPDTDPHVRWCGRGAAVTYRRPLSRFTGENQHMLVPAFPFQLEGC